MKLEIEIRVTLDPKQMELLLKAIKEKTTILEEGKEGITEEGEG